jgi:hypothetical protein
MINKFSANLIINSSMKKDWTFEEHHNTCKVIQGNRFYALYKPKGNAALD